MIRKIDQNGQVVTFKKVYLKKAQPEHYSEQDIFYITPLFIKSLLFAMEHSCITEIDRVFLITDPGNAGRTGNNAVGPFKQLCYLRQQSEYAADRVREGNEYSHFSYPGDSM